MGRFTEMGILSQLVRYPRITVSVPAGETAWGADLGPIEGPAMVQYVADGEKVTASIIKRR